MPYPTNTYAGMNSYNKQEVVRVNGRNGANAYQMAPNSSILLLDETAPIVWLKTTDGASYPTVTGYSITPLEVPQTQQILPDIYKNLEDRVKRLEEAIRDGKESNASDAKQSVKTIVKSNS